MRCLLLSSCWLLVAGCTSAYRSLQPATGDVALLQNFKPKFGVALYKAQVEVLNNYLGGLLLVKRMPDSSMRLVFSNEIGVKFFDFEFATDGAFIVHSVIAQMDKKAVITTLRKDFELLLMDRVVTPSPIITVDSSLRYFSFARGGDYFHYITQRSDNSLVRMERSSKRKPVVRATVLNYKNGIPDSIGISHLNFKFNIALKRLER